ncbi:DnaJ domain-containing protein [Haloarcula nitratireducens]|uniref:DnaJ domain-containing protein n=1 Tax=Haloarcula nitratireducens TaxID=2487749 RepID=A0AAW4PHL9_9EURY|nr:DnaJ domain-containing protein [Halomicroarcula nitratireducens]MBX0296682.1 DnaJ domain-containing protein [Halomicroarcula nitratireducens]
MSATQEFTAPDINREDYYERLGVPPSADATDIANHTKKYVAEFKPELSTHDNADERWKQFNKARQTLNSTDSKEDYDTFRERFGAEQATEAYETWQANDALGDPNSVSARDLGLESEVDESESGHKTHDQEWNKQRSSSRDQQQNRSTREERRHERARRRQAGETDIDTDSSKTYSTRATDGGKRTGTNETTDADKDETEDDESGTFGRVIDHVRSTVDLAAMEVSTMFSLLDLVGVSYLLYVLVVEFVLGSVPIPIIRDAGTVAVSLALVGLLSVAYLDRFSDRVTSGGRASVGNQFTKSTTPTRLLALPALFAVLWSLVLLIGGGALTILLLAVSVACLYGRLRGVSNVVDIPDWTENIEVAGGALAAIIFIVLFIQSGQVTGTGPLATVGIGIVLLALIGTPIAAVRQQLSR